jgi:hypothetical protein
MLACNVLKVFAGPTIDGGGFTAKFTTCKTFTRGRRLTFIGANPIYALPVKGKSCYSSDSLPLLCMTIGTFSESAGICVGSPWTN